MPDGFSWGAFVFTGVWALWNRMWIVGAIVAAILLLGTVLPPALQFLLMLAVNILMGLHANDLLGWSLARRGYSEIALGNGNSLEEAELLFYADGLSIPSLPAPMSRHLMRLASLAQKVECHEGGDYRLWLRQPALCPESL